MAYKWKPNKAQREAFKERMQDPEERAAYEQRKEERNEKRRATSLFDYESAGGRYVPTQYQYHEASRLLGGNLTSGQTDACNQVISGYINNERIHHDHIHIVNELIRTGH